MGVPSNEQNICSVTRAKTLRIFLREGERTPFGKLQEVMRVGSSVAMAPEQRQLPQLCWLSEEYTDVLMDGVSVSIADITDTVNYLAARIRSVTEAHVLRGFDVTFINHLLQSPVFDDFRNRKSGYSFLDDSRNLWTKTKLPLVKYLLRTFDNAFVRSTSSALRLKMDGINTWCKYVDEITKLWISLIHIIAGQPSRGSELSAYLIKNSISGERSIYMYASQFLFIQRYHKGLSKAGHHKIIARFLPTEFTADFMTYVAVIRPALAFFMRFFPSGIFQQADEPDSNQFYLCFTQQRGVLNGKACNGIIHDTFLERNLDISVSQYRHIAIGFMEKHLKYKLEPRKLLDLQAAHSSEVASTAYSRSTTDPYFISRDDLFEYLRCSTQWQKLISSRRKQQLKVLPTKRHTSYVLSREEHTDPPEQDAVVKLFPNTTSSFRQAAMDIESALAKLLPCHYVAAKTALKEMFNNPQAKFKSIQQCSVAALIRERVTNLLVVLPTNAGKSLLYQLAAFSAPNRVVLVVIPLAALLLESVEKCRKIGIHCAAYDLRMNPHTDLIPLLFVSADYLPHPSFMSYARTLLERGLLNHIFFDEAHVALTSHNYRVCMDSSAVLAAFHVPKVLMTATLPRSWERDLEARFGFPFATLRRPTVRPELCYSIHEVQTLEQMMVTCVEMVKQNLSFPDKGIVFVMTKREVNEVANFLGAAMSDKAVPYYHSDLSNVEKKVQLDRWRSIDAPFIVATSGLGQGVDYPHIRKVIHYGLSHNVIDYAQETGRAGRDGNRAECSTIYCRACSQSVLESPHLKIKCIENRDIIELDKFMQSTTTCRRRELQMVLDGSGYPCTIDDETELCDFCSQQSGEVQIPNQHYISQNFTSAADYAPAVDLAVQVASVHAASTQQNDVLIYNTLKQYLFNDNSRYCRLCWVACGSSAELHDERRCHRLAGCCLKCLGNHSARECFNQLKYGDRSCYFCGLPLIDVLGKNTLHFGSKPGLECSSRARHAMIPGVWLFFRAQKRLDSSNTVFGLHRLSEKQFSSWLVAKPPSSSMTNLCRLWAYLLRNPVLLSSASI